MPKRHAVRAMTTCPLCGEPVRCSYWRLHDYAPGRLPAWEINHRRVGGARCKGVVGGLEGDPFAGPDGSRARADGARMSPAAEIEPRSPRSA